MVTTPAGVTRVRLAQEWGDGFTWALIAGLGIALAVLLTSILYDLYCVML